MVKVLAVILIQRHYAVSAPLLNATLSDKEMKDTHSTREFGFQSNPELGESRRVGALLSFEEWVPFFLLLSRRNRLSAPPKQVETQRLTAARGSLSARLGQSTQPPRLDDGRPKALYIEFMARVFMERVAFATLLLLFSPMAGSAQVDDFCDVLDADIVADDGQFIGRITPDPVAIDSLLNPTGDYGSEFSRLSIFNPFGPYGGTFSSLSPFNPTTFFPPRILRNAQPLARLTVNEFFSPRVDPDELVTWLRSDQAEACFQPTPSPTASPQPSSTVTATPTASHSPTATSSDATPRATATTIAPPTAPPTATTPRPTRTPPASSTPFDRTPPTDDDDEGCAVVAPTSTSTCVLLVLPIAGLQLLRRRPRGRREPVAGRAAYGEVAT
jgi:hypothetical protein